MTGFVEKWIKYLETRRGDYEFRSRTRYKDVADRLFNMGLLNWHSLMDVGAGSCHFGQYLHERGWRGLYLPIDAVIDGTDLETWQPPLGCVDFVTCIETVEHVTCPARLIAALKRAARRGVVLTTPNSETVDVIACDPTHVSVVPYATLEILGFSVHRHSWFGTADDSLLAWRCPWRCL